MPPIINSLGIKLAHLESGTFTMGSPDDEEGHQTDETLHKVTVARSFYIGVHHITRGQFAVFTREHGYKTEAEAEGWAYAWIGNAWDRRRVSWQWPGFEQNDDHPAVAVSWNDALAFVQWLGRREGKMYRLPTEVEWEYACRATITTAFNTGPTLAADQANFGNRHKTTPVGSFPPNKWGLHDMHGNAWQ